MSITTLVLVRHGETEANVSAVWHGSLDGPLTARGQIQVAATATRFVTLAPALGGVDAFYVSPLPRAQATAAAIAQAIGVTPVVDDDLREFTLGDWEGRSFAELASAENLWKIWAIDPYFAPPNGESPALFARRAITATRRLTDAHPGQTLLIVTHGGFICHLLALWLGSGAGDWQRWEPHNCAITVLRGGGNAWTGELVNDISHLPPSAIAQHDASAYASQP